MTSPRTLLAARYCWFPANGGGLPRNETYVHWLADHRIAVYGTAIVLVASFGLYYLYLAILNRTTKNASQHYQRRNAFKTIVSVIAIILIVVLWARLLEHTGTFLGILGAGVAIALREPLLSIAGRIAILAGRMFSVGDRIQIHNMSGDVIDVGFFYIRMMEIGNWIKADQATGRILQIPNSQVFGTPIYNYTQNFSYIWDEVVLPITYASNLEAATQILTEVGAQYTREFMQTAEADLERMRRSFLIPAFDLKPHVFLRVTSNWLELSLRYVTDPKKRRQATNFIFQEVFKRLREHNDIQIGSTTMDLTIHEDDKNEGTPEKAA